MKHRRAIHVALLLGTIVLGIASRRPESGLPTFVAEYAGDTAWAAAAFWAVAIARPRARTVHVAAIALGIAVAVEVSQLYHAPWIDAIRGTTPGALVLGFGFLWSDLVCYVVGVALAGTLDLAVRGRRDRGQRTPSR